MHVEVFPNGKSVLLITVVPLIESWIVLKSQRDYMPDDPLLMAPENKLDGKEESAIEQPEIPDTIHMSAGKLEGVKKGYTTELWKDKAIGLLKSYFTKFRSNSLTKHRKKHNTIVNSPGTKLIMTRGRIIDGRLTILKIFYCDITTQIRLRLYDNDSRSAQAFVLDNFNYADMTQDEFIEKMNKVIDKIEYNKTQSMYFIGLDDTQKEEDKIIGVVQVSRDERETAEITSKGEPFSSEQTSISLHEIYRGVKKIGNEYYKILVYISNEGKGEIHAIKESDSNKQIIEIKTDLEGFMKVNTGAEGELNLGRMVYKGITAKDDGLLYFNDEQLKVAIVSYSFRQRSQKLTKVQTRFRLCMAREKMELIRSKIAKTYVLKTEFGMKIGKQYHFIKIIKPARSSNTIIIKSNKAKNEIELDIAKYGLNEAIDLCAFKARLKAILPAFLAYDRTKMMLVLYKRKETPSK